MGQNFLVDRNILNILLGAAAVTPSDHVLEIGPGLGVLTEALLDRAGRVTAVEKDGRLYRFLDETLAGRPNLTLQHADILDVDLGAMLAAGIGAVVSNLPYAAGSRALAEIVKADVFPATIVVTVQLETAERLASEPGGRAYGLLSAWAQWRYAVTRVKRISPTCFWPPPEVTSAIVKLTRRPDAPGAGTISTAFHELTKRAFAHRRKQLARVLGASGPDSPDAWRERLRAVGADPLARAESLTIEQWRALAGQGRIIAQVCGSSRSHYGRSLSKTGRAPGPSGAGLPGNRRAGDCAPYLETP
jgi:16S rRNA (adenine1518-N6/adenine1519-N6)-dimethyltransferase